MKTQLKKIIIGAAALLFVMSGVSFAYDGHDRHHKPHRKAYGLYKAKKHHPYWNNKHFKPWRHYRDRYIYKEVQHHHENDHRRRDPRADLIYKVVFKDPGIVFKVILKEH
jgi:hypothetical protein